VEVQGHDIAYDVENQTLSCFGKVVKLRLINERVKLRLLIDRTSIEIFGNDGEVSMSCCYLPEAANHRLALRAEEKGIVINALTVHELRSAWEHA